MWVQCKGYGNEYVTSEPSLNLGIDCCVRFCEMCFGKASISSFSLEMKIKYQGRVDYQESGASEIVSVAKAIKTMTPFIMKKKRHGN